MKPAPFQYHSPTTVDEAATLLVDYEEAELLAGNQSLALQMGTRLAKPAHLIDLNGIDELAFIREDETAIEIGAMTRHATIADSSTLAERLPILPEAAGMIAGPAVRNRGTLGGSVAEADPAGNYPTVLTALDATLSCYSQSGRREVAARDFFLAYMLTDLQAGEFVSSARIESAPFPPDRTGMAFIELKRVPQTWPKLAAAGIVRVDDPSATAPHIEEARLAFANAADTPLRVAAAEAAVEGDTLSQDALADAAEAAMAAADPASEMQADAEYKEEQVGVFARRAIEAAYDRSRR